MAVMVVTPEEGVNTRPGNRSLPRRFGVAETLEGQIQFFCSMKTLIICVRLIYPSSVTIKIGQYM
jgi:hypothetical protein